MVSVGPAATIGALFGAAGAFAVAAGASWMAWRPPRPSREERAFRACRDALALDAESERTLRAMADALRATKPDAAPVALLLSRAAFREAARVHRVRRGVRDDAVIERLARTLHVAPGSARNEKRPATGGARPIVRS